MKGELLKFWRLLCICLTSALFAQAQAPSLLEGVITNKKGQPIASVTVTIRETAQSTMTDEAGTFRLNVRNRSAVTIDVSSVGFASQVVSVTLSGKPVTIMLEEGNNNMGEIVVTASSGKRVQQVMPMSVSTLGFSKIQRVKFNSQADILRSVPGVTAEGGGGELASNIFVRGLPSGGQYQFTPLQIDGMPVISTMGLNSSAPDVYFRNDLGISRIEFVRGGSATLYGMGSVAGIINYSSKLGTDKQQTMIETEVASPGKIKLDFNTGGALQPGSLYYNVAGTYRFDNGPIRTGLPSNGYQIRANLRKVFNEGSFTIYTQLIDDRVQFFLPYHLTSNRERPVGWDGKTIMTMQTADVTNLSVRTPNGLYQSRAADGVATKGGYVMGAFEKRFANDWKLDMKFRTARYQHQFNFFGVDGSGRNPITQRIFVDSVAARPPQVPTSYNFTYANDGSPLNPNSLILENNMTDRNRPLNEMAGNFNLSKSISGDKASHTINLGSFVSRTEAGDYNVQIRYLSEFRDQPQVINLRYTDGTTPRNYTVNGVRSVPGYTNKFVTSNKAAVYLTDEIVISKLRIDLGFRWETITGRVTNEKTSTAVNADGLNVTWGNGAFDKFTVTASDWAGSIAASYQVKRNLSVYGNFSRGYFFPELRGPRVTYVNGVAKYPVYKPERIIQGEIGAKLSTKKGLATVAVFTNRLNDRLNVLFLNVGGSVQEVANVLSSKTTGIEATVDQEIIKNVRVDGGLTFMQHEYTKDDTAPTNVGKWLERQPRFMYNAGITYDNRKFDAGFHTEYFGKRYGNASNLVLLDAYSIARIDMGYTFRMDDASLKISAGIFNVFNNEGITEGNPRAGNTQTNTGDFFVGRPIIPRSFFARATLSF